MILRSLWLLLKKDLTLFFRSRVSSIVIILLPVLIVLLAGFAFNSNNLSNIHVGVHKSVNGTNVDSVISGFESKGFHAVYYPTLEDCINSVKLANTQICVDFSKNTSLGSQEDVKFYVDYSRVNLANTLVNIANSKVRSTSLNVSKGKVEGILGKVSYVEEKLPTSISLVDSGKSYLQSSISSSSQSTSSLADISNAISVVHKLQASVNSSDTVSVSYLNSLGTILGNAYNAQSSADSKINSSLASQKDSLSKLSSAHVNLNSLVTYLKSNDSGNLNEIISPIKTSVLPISQDSKSRDFLLPNLLALISLFGAILLSSTFVLKNKKTRAFFRNFSTPTNNVLFVLSMYLASIIILAIQFSLIFLAIKFILGMSLTILTGTMLLTLFLAWSVFIFIGMFVGYLFRSEETIIFASMIVASIFMFFSNIIIPLENISTNFLKYAVFNPLVLVHSTLNKILFFNLGFTSLYKDFIALGIFFVVFFSLTVIARNMTKRIL